MEEQVWIVPTLDWLEVWWEAHPQAVAMPGHACQCVVALPLAEAMGLPVSFVPGEHNVHVWRAGTKQGQMDTNNGRAYLLRQVAVGKEIDTLGIAFDYRHNDFVTASECLAIIRAVRKEGE